MAMVVIRLFWVVLQDFLTWCLGLGSFVVPEKSGEKRGWSKTIKISINYAYTISTCIL